MPSTPSVPGDTSLETYAQSIPVFSPSSASTWLYLCLYCSPSTSEEFLATILGPAEKRLREQSLIERFFFIRYLEGGYHLRIRFFGTRAHLLTSVRAHLNEQIREFFAERDYTIGEPLDDGPNGMEDDLWLPHSAPQTSRPIPSYEYNRYEPEVERYGGEVGLLLSEDHFQQSSYVAMRVMEYEQIGRRSRYNAIFLLMQAAFEAFHRDILTGFQRQFTYWASSVWVTPQHQQQYTKEFARYKSTLAHLFHQKEPISPSKAVWQHIVEPWHREMCQLYLHLCTLSDQGLLSTPITDLLVYYLHMLCNRLGVLPSEEACLAYMAYMSYCEQTELASHHTSLFDA